ncbi:MAG: hypothetical protein HRU41_09090 [Saprospiraceae bacterium]|nr:hypothetical protein [Saprospiraceae bacterium]
MITRKKQWNNIALFFFYFTLSSTALGAATTEEETIFDVLNYAEVVKVDLSYDVRAVDENRRDDSSYPGTLSFRDQQGSKQDWKVNISLRGAFRRIHCDERPPLRIDFRKEDLEEQGLLPFDDFKLVTYCMGDDIVAKEALVREYLAYKLYNELSDISFRAQLLKINFKDINTGETKSQLGFIIEDTAQLRARSNSSKSEEKRILNKEEFDSYYLQTTALFQYMIGNTDWGLTYSKNIKYFRKDNKVIPVPYDFDFAVIVDAPYAVPRDDNDGDYHYGRLYRGFKEETQVLQPVIDNFISKKEGLVNVIRNCKQLRPGSRRKMIAYLMSFFENPQQIEFAEGMI